jgi:DNA-binding transcriptional MerR regulator
MLKGHGSIAYYPENTINLIKWIKEWQAEGETLKTIRERLDKLKDVTPKEEILIPVESDKLGDFTEAYQKVYDEVRRRLDPENKPSYGFWIRFELIEKDGKNYYKITGALSPKTKE